MPPRVQLIVRPITSINNEFNNTYEATFQCRECSEHDVDFFFLCLYSLPLLLKGTLFDAPQFHNAERSTTATEV